MSPTATDEVSYDTVTYTYDTRGNLLSKTYLLENVIVETVSYQYTDTVWNDRLTAFDGEAIAYDQIGNPLNWTDGATLSWQRGRQLASFIRGNTAVSYTYNDEGIRTSKNVNGTTTSYNILGGSLRSLSDGTNTLRFFENSVEFNGTEYWYVYNAQNDVIGLIDNTGEYVVRYTYSAYGLPLSKTGTMADTLGTLNPFRYRGYVYDEETGLYYVSSRYYDPTIGRFLNSDTEAVVLASLNSACWNKNLYAYCDNNPIMRIDSSGEYWHIIVGAAIGGTVSFITTMATGGTWLEGLEAFVVGNVVGALMAFGGTGATIAGSCISGVYSGYTCYRSGGTMGAAVTCTVISAVTSVASMGTIYSSTASLQGVVNNPKLFITLVSAPFDLGVGLLDGAVTTSISQTQQRMTWQIHNRSTKYTASSNYGFFGFRSTSAYTTPYMPTTPYSSNTGVFGYVSYSQYTTRY